MHNHTTQVPIHPRTEVHAHTHVCTQPDAVSLGPTQPLRTQRCGRAKDSCPDSDLSLGACQSPRHNDAHMPSHTLAVAYDKKRIPMAAIPDLDSQLEHLPPPQPTHVCSHNLQVPWQTGPHQAPLPSSVLISVSAFTSPARSLGEEGLQDEE